MGLSVILWYIDSSYKKFRNVIPSAIIMDWISDFWSAHIDCLLSPVKILKPKYFDFVGTHYKKIMSYVCGSSAIIIDFGQICTRLSFSSIKQGYISPVLMLDQINDHSISITDNQISVEAILTVLNEYTRC